MLTDNARSLGGIATGKIKRQEAIEKYYESPKYCLQCKNIIEVKEGQKVSEVRVKEFCSQSCSATFHNSKRRKKEKEPKKTRIEKSEEYYKNLTKKEFFDKCINYFSARCTITKIAKRNLERSKVDKVCYNCDYDKHVEVCHIKAVSEFSDESMMFDMNAVNNLVYLCPNCHWEFDHELLTLRVRAVGSSTLS